MKSRILFLIALSLIIIFFCTNNRSTKIGYAYEYSDLVHVAFVFPISEKISNDTLFVIVVSDTLIECVNKNGGVMYARSFKTQNYD